VIRVLSGAVNSGKTSHLRLETEKLPRCGGFLSPKVFQNEQCIGYDLFFLRSREQIPFIRKKAYCDPREELEERLGDFGFYNSGFNAARRELKALSREDANLPVFIDELGPIELKGSGYLHGVLVVLQKMHNITLCIRTKMVNDMTDKLNIDKYMLISIERDKTFQELVHV